LLGLIRYYGYKRTLESKADAILLAATLAFLYSAEMNLSRERDLSYTFSLGEGNGILGWEIWSTPSTKMFLQSDSHDLDRESPISDVKGPMLACQ
jgi:hypothetical protein